MILTRVTITGIDEKTNLKSLVKLQEDYPFAEFGILLAYHWQENGQRFPNPTLLSNLEGLGLNLSAHFCGTSALDIVRGKRFKAMELIQSGQKLFRRCQLNLFAGDYFTELRRLQPIQFFDEIIMQMHTPELCERFLQGEHPKNMSYLLDASGGQGIDTSIQVLNVPTVHIGYAGGIGPENVEEKLRLLLDSDNKGRFWIDMETRVRTDEWLDLDKVEAVMKTCDVILKNI